MVEKRKHDRMAVKKISVKCKILNKHKKARVSHEINSEVHDFSEGGVRLFWPKSWDCKVCLKCLAWVFNHACTLKEEIYRKEHNKYLTPSTLVQVDLRPPVAPQPVRTIAKVAWVRPEINRRGYGIGLSFLKGNDSRLEKNRLGTKGRSSLS